MSAVDPTEVEQAVEYLRAEYFYHIERYGEMLLICQSARQPRAKGDLMTEAEIIDFAKRIGHRPSPRSKEQVTPDA